MMAVTPGQKEARRFATREAAVAMAERIVAPFGYNFKPIKLDV
jgi:hypothetical protein